MKDVNSEGFRMQRKLSLLAPGAVVPCLILVFVGLHGGRGVEGAAARGEVKGVNMSLPVVQLNNKDKAPDKMELYARAARDSAKMEELRKQDPYAVGTVHKKETTDAAAERLLAKVNDLKGALPAMGKRLPDRLERLPDWSERLPDRSQRLPDGLQRLPDRSDRLKDLLENVQKRAVVRKDPEMEEANALLDKIFRVQHPELLKAAAGGALMAAAIPLEREKREGPVQLLQGNEGTVEQSSGFMEIGEKDQPEAADTARDYALEALVDGEQTLTAGSTVAFRLAEGASINGQPVPAGQALYGAASLSGERLRVSISSLRVGERILPVAIEVYDLDGLPGIRVPGAISREVSKESAAEAVSSLGVASLDPSVSVQAANAGLQLAKSLASRKVRQVRVTLPADYQVLLRNNKSGIH